jgi:ADP-ribosylglycohydrolase
MIGAVIGDIIGSVYERRNIKTVDFPLFSPRCRFTDDSVLTIATADALLHGIPYDTIYRRYYRLYPNAGYGGGFIKWAKSAGAGPYNSYGNGSAMRVSPAGYARDDMVGVLEEARISASVTHNHPEGIKGATAVAAAVFLARTGSSKEMIREFTADTFSYDLAEPLDSIRRHYGFDVSCQGSVPEAITAFLESDSYEDAVRKAVSIGGDSDTIACMAGAIAGAFYREIPEEIEKKALSMLDDRLRAVISDFRNNYRC